MKQYYDQNRRPIYEGDILKVFHFIGSRNKRHFMYKVVKNTSYGLMAFDATDLGLNKELRDCHKYMISHGSNELNIIEGTEIVQGHTNGDFNDREKLK